MDQEEKLDLLGLQEKKEKSVCKVSQDILEDQEKREIKEQLEKVDSLEIKETGYNNLALITLILLLY